MHWAISMAAAGSFCAEAPSTEELVTLLWLEQEEDGIEFFASHPTRPVSGSVELDITARYGPHRLRWSETIELDSAQMGILRIPVEARLTTEPNAYATHLSVRAATEFGPALVESLEVVWPSGDTPIVEPESLNLAVVGGVWAASPMGSELDAATTLLPLTIREDAPSVDTGLAQQEAPEPEIPEATEEPLEVGVEP